MTRVRSKLPEILDADTAGALLSLLSWRTVILQRRKLSIRVDVYRDSPRARVRVYDGRAHRSRPIVDISLDRDEFLGLLRARIFRHSLNLEYRLELGGEVIRVEEEPGVLKIVWRPYSERVEIQKVLSNLPTVPIVERRESTYVITLAVPDTDVDFRSDRRPRGAHSDATFSSTSSSRRGDYDVAFALQEAGLEEETDASLWARGGGRPPDSGVSFRGGIQGRETGVRIGGNPPGSWGENRRHVQREMPALGAETDTTTEAKELPGAREFLEAFALDNPWGQVLASRSRP